MPEESWIFMVYLSIGLFGSISARVLSKEKMSLFSLISIVFSWPIHLVFLLLKVKI